MDIDVLFSKHAINYNHRMLITHSMIPGIGVTLIGLFFLYPPLIISGFSLFLHVFIDTFDWGTNLLYFPKKLYGLKLLITEEEFNNLDDLLSNFNRPEAFFDFKYYNNKFCLITEFLFFIHMLIFLLLLAIEYLYLIMFYFFFLAFHLFRHYFLKTKEKGINSYE